MKLGYSTKNLNQLSELEIFQEEPLLETHLQQVTQYYVLEETESLGYSGLCLELTCKILIFEFKFTKINSDSTYFK